MAVEVSFNLLHDVSVKTIDSNKVPLFVGEKRKLQVSVTGLEVQPEIKYQFYKDGATDEEGEEPTAKEVENGVVILEPQESGKHILEIHVALDEETIIRKFNLNVRS